MDRPGDHEHHRTVRGGKKKLRAGIRYSLNASGDSGTKFDCHDCDEKKRGRRNCRNRQGLKRTILTGPVEWRSVTSRLAHILKIEDTKFFECPSSVIKPRTWQILRLVNETTGGEHTDLLHLPFPGTILDQPAWFREAVGIVRQERARHQQHQMETLRGT